MTTTNTAKSNANKNEVDPSSQLVDTSSGFIIETLNDLVPTLQADMENLLKYYTPEDIERMKLHWSLFTSKLKKMDEPEFQGIFFSPEDLNQPISSLGGIANEFLERLGTMFPDRNHMNEAISQVEKLATQTLHNYEKVNENIASLSYGTKGACAVVQTFAFAFLVHDFFKKPSKMAALRVVILFVSMWFTKDQFADFFTLCFPEISAVISKIIAYFFNKEEEKSEVELQSFEIDSKLLTTVIEAITHSSTIMLGVSGKISSKTLLTTIKTSESLPKFLTQMVKSLTVIWNSLIAEKMGFDPVVFKTLDDPYLELLDKKINKILRDKADGVLPMTVEQLHQISQLIMECENVYKKLPQDRDLQESKKLIYDRMNDLRRLEMEFRNLHVEREGFRQEPVGVLLRGGPGVMKSTIMEHIAFAFNAATLKSPDLEHFKISPHTYTYCYKAEIPHQDGFSLKTNVMLVDDFQQMREVAGMPASESFFIIRGINSFQSTLHSAALEGKGNLHDRSKLYVASTNAGPNRIKAPSVNSVDAVLRRFVLQFIVTPKPELCKNPTDDLMMQKVDVSLLPRTKLGEGTEADVTPHHFLFHRTDMHGNTSSELGVFEFDEVMKMILEEEHKRATWVEQHKLNFLKTVNEYELQAAYKSEATSEFQSCHDPTLDDLFSLLHDEEIPDYDPYALLRHNYPDDPHIDMFIEIIEKSKSILMEAACYGQQSRIWRNIPSSLNPVWNCYQMFRFDKTILQKLHYCRRLENLYEFEIPWEAPNALKSEYVEVKSISSTIKNFMQKAYSTFYALLESFTNIVSSPIFMILGIAAAAYTIYSYVTGNDSSEMQMNYMEPKNTKDRVSKMTLNQIKAELQLQGADTQGKDILDSVMKKNVFRLVFSKESRIIKDSKYTLLGRCTSLDKGMFIMPRHYVDLIFEVVQTDSEVTHVHVLDDEDTSVASCKVLEFIENTSEESLVESHLIVVNFPSFKPLKGILKYFLAQDKFQRMSSTFTVTFQLPSLKEFNFSEAHLKKCNLRGVEVVKGLQYKADSGVGDCGVPLIVRMPSLGVERIIGFHIAGLPKGKGYDAYAGVVTQEDIMKATSKFTSVLEDAAHTSLDEYLEPQGIPPCISECFTVLGKYPKKHSPYGKSRIIKTDLNDPIFHTTIMAPAMTMPRMGIDPFAKSLTKYCKVTAKPDINIIRQAAEDLKCEWSKYKHLKPSVPMTLEAAIWGSAEHGLDSIKASTSPGAPLKWEDKHIKKRLFGPDAIRGVENPQYEEILTDFKQFLLDCKAGKRRLWLFTDNEKDERRKIEKAYSGDSRLFNGADLIMYIYFRYFFGSFMGWFMNLSMELGASIKINPYSGDWNDIAQKLSSFDISVDPAVGAGDYRAFDGCEMPIIHDIILMMINWWYDDGEENENIRKILWKELTNSRHLCGDIIYEWFCSLPSGHPFTIIVNCIYNQIAFRYCYYRMIEVHGDGFTAVMRATVFAKAVILFVLGDDNIFSVSDEFKEFFNELTLPQYMAEIGLIYTTESKGKAVLPFRKLSEVNFLKRSFRFEKLYGTYVGPLLLESLLEIPMWIKVGDSNEGNFIQNIENFIRELSLHDSTVFESYKRKLHEALRLLNPRVLEHADIHRSRNAYLVEVCNRGMHF